MTWRLADTTNAILSEDADIHSVNISATTNGHVGEPGDHQSGDAVDVSYVNGVRIGDTGEGYEYAKELKDDAMNDPNVRYVEGPGGNFARATPDSPWVRSQKLRTMNNHVHWSVFPVRR